MSPLLVEELESRQLLNGSRFAPPLFTPMPQPGRPGGGYVERPQFDLGGAQPRLPAYFVASQHRGPAPEQRQVAPQVIPPEGEPRLPASFVAPPHRSPAPVEQGQLAPAGGEPRLSASFVGPEHRGPVPEQRHLGPGPQRNQAATSGPRRVVENVPAPRPLDQASPAIRGVPPASPSGFAGAHRATGGHR
jgi:hypothetical protein